MPGARRDDTQPQTREDVGVVALARNERATAEIHGIEGTAAGKDRPAFAPAIGLVGRAFCLGSGIGQREDNGPLVQPAHQANELFGEHAGLARAAQQGRGLQAFHGFQQVVYRLVLVGEGSLLRRQAVATLFQVSPPPCEIGVM